MVDLFVYQELRPTWTDDTRPLPTCDPQAEAGWKLLTETHVAAVGYADNTQEGDYSRLQNLTIEEYRQRRLAHELARASQALR